jgi:hypothetical protein
MWKRTMIWQRRRKKSSFDFNWRNITVAKYIRLAILCFAFCAAASVHAQVTGTPPHKANLVWGAPSPVGGSGTIKCYNLYRLQIPATTYAQLQACIAGTSYVDSAVTPGQAYSYEVTTVDTSSNESVGSNPSQITMPTNPNPPTAPTITLAQLTINTDGTETALVKFTDAPNEAEVVLFFDGSQKLLGQRIIAASSVSSFAQNLTVPSGTSISVSVCNSVGACSSAQAM